MRHRFSLSVTSSGDMTMEEKTKAEQLTDELAGLLRELYLHQAEELAAQTGEQDLYRRLYTGPSNYTPLIRIWAKDSATGAAREAADFAAGEVSRYLFGTLNRKAIEPFGVLPDNEPWAPVERGPKAKTDLFWTLERLVAQHSMKVCEAEGLSFKDVFSFVGLEGLEEWSGMLESWILNDMGGRIAEDFEELRVHDAHDATRNWDNGRTTERGD